MFIYAEEESETHSHRATKGRAKPEHLSPGPFPNSESTETHPGGYAWRGPEIYH